MTDPKRKAAVAAVDAAFDYADEAPGPASWAEGFVDAMLANPQPFLALLLRVDAVAAALAPDWAPDERAEAERLIAALTETAAEPAP